MSAAVPATTPRATPRATVPVLARVVWSTMRAPVVVLLLLYAACGLAAARGTHGAPALAEDGRARAASWTGHWLAVQETGLADLLRLAHVAAVLLPFLACAAVVNDLADVDVDRANLPGDTQRVLARGAAHRRHLVVVAVASAVVTVAAAATLGPVALGVALAGLLLATAYSLPPLRLAKRGIVASLVLPALYVAVPLVLGAVAGGGAPRGVLVPLLVALWTGFVGRIVLKDFRDLRGDALFGKRTFLVRHGRLATCRVSGVCWVAGTALLLLSRPHPSPAWVLSTVAGTGLALFLLRELARDRGHRHDERVISALAVAGRGLVLVLLVELVAPTAGWAAWLAATATVLLAAGLGGQACRMLRHGPDPRRLRGLPEPRANRARRVLVR